MPVGAELEPGRGRNDYGSGPRPHHVRAEYETSDYHQAWPKLLATALLLRADLYDQLLVHARDQLVILASWAPAPSSLADASA